MEDMCAVVVVVVVISSAILSLFYVIVYGVFGLLCVYSRPQMASFSFRLE